MTSLFKDIEDCLAKVPHGWASVPKCQMLAATVIALRPEISVIIGVWAGRDTFALGLAHKEIGKGKVIAIDPWTANASAKGQTGENKTWWSDQKMHEEIYQGFLEKRGEFGLNDVIEIQRTTSEKAIVPKSIDGILVVDGNHGPAAIMDVERFCPSVEIGAFVLLDDLNWVCGSVQKAAVRILQLGFKEKYRIETGAMYQRIK